MTDEFAQLLRSAHDSNAPYPSYLDVQPDADLEAAYRVQRQFVDALPGQIIGYKAALTAEGGQHALGVDQPVVGVLFDWCATTADGARRQPRRVAIETELGYRLKRDVETPVSPETVTEVVGSCYPMLEIAAINLESPNGIDMVASNSATWQFIRGNPVGLDEIDIDAITVSLTRDGELLHEAGSSTVMGSQRQALAWLINEVLARGYTLREGMLLMSGSIGPPQPGKAGAWRGDFSGMMSLELVLE